MLLEHKRKTNIGVGIGIALTITSYLLNIKIEKLGEGTDTTLLTLFGIISAIGSLIGMVYGCIHYAKGKGYHPALGLLGVLNFFGLVILALLRDKHANQTSTNQGSVQ